HHGQAEQGLAAEQDTSARRACGHSRSGAVTPGVVDGSVPAVPGCRPVVGAPGFMAGTSSIERFVSHTNSTAVKAARTNPPAVTVMVRPRRRRGRRVTGAGGGNP